MSEIFDIKSDKLTGAIFIETRPDSIREISRRSFINFTRLSLCLLIFDNLSSTAFGISPIVPDIIIEA